MSESHRPAAAGTGAHPIVSHPELAELHVVSPARFEQPRLEEEIDFGYFRRALTRYWMLVVAGGVLGAIIGYSMTLGRPIRYQAATTVLITQAISPVAIATTRALFENNAVAAEVLRETGLDKPPFGLTAPGFVGGALQIEDVRGTNLIKVRVTLSDPNKAAEASTLLARKAVALNGRLANAESAALRGQLKEHVDSAAERLKQAEQLLLAYRNDAQVELLKKDTDAMLGERGALLKLLIAIEAEKGMLAAAEQEIQKQEPLLSVARSVPSEQALRRAAPEREETLADPKALDLSNPYINPVYQTLAFQIATSRTRLAGLERERREMVVVRRLGDSHFQKLSELYGRELELTRLQTSYELARRVYAELALRYEQIRTEPVSRMVMLQVVDEAIPPGSPIPTRRNQSTAMGLVAGLFLAVAIAFALSSGGRTADASRRA